MDIVFNTLRQMGGSAAKSALRARLITRKPFSGESSPSAAVTKCLEHLVRERELIETEESARSDGLWHHKVLSLPVIPERAALTAMAKGDLLKLEWDLMERVLGWISFEQHSGDGGKDFVTHLDSTNELVEVYRRA